jgi:hypothetical protein
MVKYQWFVENRPTHFAAYRLPTKSVPGLLCLTLFEREEYFAWFSKTIEKNPIGILSTRAITKPSSSFFFHFQNDIKENLVSKPREKNESGVGYSNTFIPDISIRKASE